MTVKARKPAAPAATRVYQADLEKDFAADPTNANRGTERGHAMLERSIGEMGAGRSIVADKNGLIPAGNKTRDALIAAGMRRAIVVETDGTTPVVVKRTDWDLADKKGKARRYAYMDNRVAELDLDWDTDRLLKDVADGIDLKDLWSGKELAALVASNEAKAGAAPAEPGEPPKNPTTRPGDVIKLGDHLLVCGDSRDPDTVNRLLKGTRIAVAVTSPPYASRRKYDESSGFKPVPPDAYVEWFDAVQANVARWLAPDGSWFVNIKEHAEDGQRSLYVMDLVLAHARRWGWLFRDELCWRNLCNGTPGHWPDRFKNAWEPVFHFSRETKIKFRPEQVSHASEQAFGYNPDRPKAGSGSGLVARTSQDAHRGMARPSNVIEAAAEVGQGDHSAPFPVAIPDFFIRAFSDAGDVVYEPFCGSGTTLVAAELLGRRCRAVEISPGYCDVIVDRWERTTSKKAVRR